MRVCRCTIRYKYRDYTPQVNSFRSVKNDNGTYVFHSISDISVKSIRYNPEKESGVAITKGYGKKSIDIFGYRTWSSPYELTLNIKDTENTPRYKRGSTKYIDCYGSANARHETTADSITLIIEKDDYIKITGLESKRNIQVDCPNDMDFFIDEDNCLDLSGTIINFYLEEQLEKFVIDGDEYTDNIHNTLEKKECVN